MVYLKPFSDVAIPLSTPMDPEPEATPMDSEPESTPMDSESDPDEFENRVEAYIIRREEQAFIRGYEEAQSRCRLSMTCKAMVRPLSYPLQARIVELAFGSRGDGKQLCLVH